MSGLAQLDGGTPLAPARDGGREAASPLRLEESTNSDGHRIENDRGKEVPLIRTRAKIIRYPDGSLEVSCTRRPRTIPRPAKRHAANEANREVGLDERISSLSVSAERARIMVRRLIMAAGLDGLLTLTFRENITNAVEADKKLTLFLRKVRDHFRANGEDFSYVAVPERQQRGAIHFHLAVKGWQPVKLLRNFWRAVVGEGNIDVRPWSAGEGNSACRLAGYLSKYMSKAIFDNACGTHRYRRSHNIRIEASVEEFDNPDLEVVIRSIFLRLLGVEPAFVSPFSVGIGPEAKEYLWACSWAGRYERPSGSTNET